MTHGLDVVRWRAWYTEGRVFNGESAEDWDVLSDRGVLSVVECFADHTSGITQGEDEYRLGRVKYGEWTTDADMDRVHAEAVAYAIAWNEAR